jgi:uncharacterized protein
MLSCNDNSNTNYVGMDYRIFNNSPIKKLMEAVRSEDLTEIEKLVKLEGCNINYQDEKHGNTLLMLSVLNHHFTSSKKLIELGADVNIHSIKSGTSVLHNVCGLGSEFNEMYELLNLLLQKGANPNDVDSIPDFNAMSNNSPIMELCDNGFDNNQQFTIKCINLLINKKCDINFLNVRKETALSLSLGFQNYDISIFLIKSGADCKRLAVDCSNINIKYNKTIIKLLNEQDFVVNSEKYKKRAQIIKYLNAKGIYK